MTNIEQLKKELQDKMAKRQAEVQSKMEEIRVTNEIRKIESPLYERRTLEDNDNTILNTIIAQIEEMYSMNNRKVHKVYGYGITVNKIMTILRAIQYAKEDEKQDLLAMTGISESMLEETLEAFGNPAYYSKRGFDILPERRPDVPTLRENLEVIRMDLGLVQPVNTGRLNSDNIDYIYRSAQLVAQETKENSLKYRDDSEGVSYTE